MTRLADALVGCGHGARPESITYRVTPIDLTSASQPYSSQRPPPLSPGCQLETSGATYSGVPCSPRSVRSPGSHGAAEPKSTSFG